MSRKATAWAYAQKLPLLQKSVLMSIALWIDQKKVESCTLSVSHLAVCSGISERSVYRALKALQGAGLISVDPRERGRLRLENTYSLSRDRKAGGE